MAKHRKAAAPATTTEAAAAAAVVQDQGAAGENGAVESTDATVAEAAAPHFPREVTIRNHGNLAICEPATRAYIGAGGNSNVVIQSMEQAVMVLSNIKSMHGGSKIQVVGLDDVASGDEGDAE